MPATRVAAEATASARLRGVSAMSTLMTLRLVCDICGRQQRLASAFRASRTPQLSPSPAHMQGQQLMLLPSNSTSSDLEGTLISKAFCSVPGLHASLLFCSVQMTTSAKIAYYTPESLCRVICRKVGPHVHDKAHICTQPVGLCIPDVMCSAEVVSRAGAHSRGG